MAYLLLGLAIVSEIIGSSMLKLSEGFTRLLPSVGSIVGYGASFYFLSLTLRVLPIGLSYAIWAGTGTALTAIIGFIFWKESFSFQTLIGLTAIIIGVAILNMPNWS
ncbi:multidrug efflux SMR transporter [Aquibacillus sp. 3ASR75-11]|uniref:Multidrug efflux SMR transporter n=1 Tax=Terrihalobacillus insolitus TaxID=2950438 RepID=A0A9X4AMU3_9BACI|nr:multidrug efflux SMR transporter [Terrihalobacillus insolitus]MDC3413159.1 multidrug efflux SMR transporter [Terrihalobacillus insolitus]MDC3425169.1 multidrug efflux SMR transporter [Terrihalobacillus insolitus]